MAVAALAGYVWLTYGGLLWVVAAALTDGAAYDASLNAVFLGYVMSMLLAHAPVIVPAVLRTALPFRRRSYGHLALLHGPLALRLLGDDLAGSHALWQWGGAGGELAILLFLVATARAALSARRPHTPVGGVASLRMRHPAAHG
jgi:hypothetical protein